MLILFKPNAPQCTDVSEVAPQEYASYLGYGKDNKDQFEESIAFV